MGRVRKSRRHAHFPYSLRGIFKVCRRQRGGQKDLSSYSKFRQDFLPLLNRLQPSWAVFERRRFHRNKKVARITNIQRTETAPVQLGLCPPV